MYEIYVVDTGEAKRALYNEGAAISAGKLLNMSTYGFNTVLFGRSTKR